MDHWKKLEALDIKDKEKYSKFFVEVFKRIRNKSWNFGQVLIKEKDYFVVTENNRKESIFVHVVPKEAYLLFMQMQRTFPDEFLGFSVLVGKHKGRDVRLSCFGVPCSLLANELVKAKD